MGKTWILDTETKGTGAHVAPLEKTRNKPAREQDLVVVALQRPPRATESVAPTAPLRFKIVDVRSSRTLAEDISARAAVDLLEGIGSVVDIRVYVWTEPAKRWRLLTLHEQRALWEFRRQSGRSQASTGVRG